MANVLNRSTLELIRSANTPDFPIADWIHNPDLSGVAGVERKYWKLAGDVPIEMTRGEKDAVDAALTQAETDADRTAKKSEMDRERLIRAVVKAMIDEINILRSQHGISGRTLEQARNAIKNEIDLI